MSRRTRPRCTPPAWSALAAALVLALLPPVSLLSADTFVLKGGGVVCGKEERRHVGTNKKAWVTVKSGFGTVEVPAEEIVRVLKSGPAGGALYAEEILLVHLEGEVSKSSDGGKSWSGVALPRRPAAADSRPVGEVSPGGANAHVAPGDRVRTGPGGTIALDIGYGVVNIAPQSEVEFRKTTAASMKLFVGEVGARLDALPKEGGFALETPQGLLAVKGTTLLVRVAQATRVAIGRGEAEFQGVSVVEGSAVETDASGLRGPEPLAATDRASLTRVEALPAVPRFVRVLVPGGSFFMGSTITGAGPAHQVRVPGFMISRYEATNRQYRVFAEWIRSSNDHRRCHPREPAGKDHTPARYSELFGADDCPVVGVDWYDAFAFCAWIGAALPAEAQWEYACRAGTTAARFDQASMDADLLSHAWFGENAQAATHPVGEKLPNPWGLFDVYGNASEWCADGYHEDYTGAPVDGGSWESPSSSLRVTRGGNWEDSSFQLSSVHRGAQDSGSRFSRLGFRPVWRLGR